MPPKKKTKHAYHPHLDPKPICPNVLHNILTKSLKTCFPPNARIVTFNIQTGFLYLIPNTLCLALEFSLPISHHITLNHHHQLSDVSNLTTALN